MFSEVSYRSRRTVLFEFGTFELGAWNLLISKRMLLISKSPAIVRHFIIEHVHYNATNEKETADKAVLSKKSKIKRYSKRRKRIAFLKFFRVQNCSITTSPEKWKQRRIGESYERSSSRSPSGHRPQLAASRRCYWIASDCPLIF